MKNFSFRKKICNFIGIFIILQSFYVLSAQDKLSGITIKNVSMTTEISQYGITWTFKNPVEFGTYVNGDYWVVGPVEIISFNPSSTSVGGRVINGSMANPGGGTNISGFDSFNSGIYSSSLNVAWDVSETNTYTANPGTSIVSSISNTTNPGSEEFLLNTAVLTVVDSEPPIGSFRPPYAGSDKSLNANYSDVDTPWLQSLSTLTPVGSIPAWSEAELNLKYPFMDFGGNWARRQVHGDHYSFTYGRETSQHFGVISLMLLTDRPLQEKEKTLTRFIQRSIDLWGIYNDAVSNGRGTPWPPAGGHHGGRKWPILFTGALIHHSGMLNIGNDAADRKDPISEDGQTEYINQDRVDTTQSSFDSYMLSQVQSNNATAWSQFQSDYPGLAAIAGTGVWRTDSRDAEFHPYTTDMIGMPEWQGIAISPSGQSYEGNAFFFFRLYRGVAANTWHAEALAALVTGLYDEWNHPAFFDYVHRHMTIARTGTDPFEVIGYDSVAGLTTTSTSWSRFWPNKDAAGTDIGAWVDSMWDQYWPSYYNFPY